ncbi:MAG: DUF6152 family protein [Gammaproteobacteria bacterium]|nr:DUF6152 family protein [Gammaproteobacteria bacterium]
MKAICKRLAVMLLACAAVFVLVAHNAAAHHSDSIYFVDDRSADGGAVRIEGTISRVRWINPHVEFFVDVPKDNGAPDVWAIETDSVNQLRALGWTDETIQAGDKVVVVVSKSKFDDTAGRLRDMLLYGSSPDEDAAIYLEYKTEGELWVAPLELYRKYTSCPGTAPYDPERQPGKETLLCARLNAQELESAIEEFGDRVLLLRGM